MAASPAREPVAASLTRPDEQIALFFERHADDVLRFCRAKLRSPADAEDVAQQVFVRAYGALLRGERVRLPRHWLLRIARNECRRHYERARRVDLVEFDEAIDVARSEEHTSELQSHSELVCRLLLEKKKKKQALPSTKKLQQQPQQQTRQNRTQK